MFIYHFVFGDDIDEADDDGDDCGKDGGDVEYGRTT